jgi:hypothetical protein
MANEYLRQAPSGGSATHTMPDGTVMPGATHAEYEAMQMQNGGAAPAISPELQERINRFAGDPGIYAKPPEMSEQERIAAQRMGEGISATGPFGEPLPLDANSGMSLQQLNEALAGQQAAPVDPAQELQEAIEGLQIQKSQTSDPDEIKALDRMIEAAMVGASAPLGQMAAQIQAEGRGEDTSLAHLRPGEVVLPPEAFEDAQFESVVNRKFEELGIDPEMAVSSVGIASLNPMTGLEEFGFFKKLAKGIKKVVKKVVRPLSKVAQFIPGPWQPVAALINKAGTVYDVAKGRANPLALLTVAGPLRTGPSIGESVGAIRDASATGGFWSGLGESFKDMPGAISKGIGSLVRDPLGTAKNLFKSQNPDDYAQDSSGAWVNKITGEGLPRGITDPSQMLSRSGSGIQSLTRGLQGNLFGTEGMMGGVTAGADAGQTTYQDAAGNVYSEQQMKAAGLLDQAGNLISQTGGFDLGDFAAGLMGGGGGSGMAGGLGSLAMAGVPAYMLGKMAYDEAKKDKGVPLTPLTTMGPTGRYNIEAEIARRMGTQTPNPVEFGLLPQGTFPQLSGGQPMAAAGGGAVYPMRYANGGDVAMEDFERMNGGINGPGSETSDDVPAMLSDGEFVFTGEAVRGAGGFDMNNQGGILTLTPSGTPDRERGTNVMYEMMDLFGSYANANASA